jgi:hypothetical protein
MSPSNFYPIYTLNHFSYIDFEELFALLVGIKTLKYIFSLKVSVLKA